MSHPPKKTAEKGLPGTNTTPPDGEKPRQYDAFLYGNTTPYIYSDPKMVMVDCTVQSRESCVMPLKGLSAELSTPDIEYRKI